MKYLVFRVERPDGINFFTFRLQEKTEPYYCTHDLRQITIVINGDTSDEIIVTFPEKEWCERGENDKYRILCRPLTPEEIQEFWDHFKNI